MPTAPVRRSGGTTSGIILARANHERAARFAGSSRRRPLTEPSCLAASILGTVSRLYDSLSFDSASGGIILRKITQMKRRETGFMSYQGPSAPMPPGQPSALGLNRIGRPDEIRSPRPDEALSAIASRNDLGISVESVTLAAIAAVILAWVGATHLYSCLPGGPQIFDNGAVKAVVERIIAVESGGDSNAKNTRSSATGAGQFLDETWLDMIRAYRHDLVEGRSEKEILDLRRDPELNRTIITRLVERNAAMLRKRGLPVTPGTVYLAHFAGAAGAVAVLSVSENVDAASLMASADSTGRTTREKLVNANPFLSELTVGDLKNWANRKMRGY